MRKQGIALNMLVGAFRVALCGVVFYGLSLGNVWAQDGAGVQTQAPAAMIDTSFPADGGASAFSDLDAMYKSKAAVHEPEVNPNDIGTMFFTLWQHTLLQEAKRGFVSRDATQGELDRQADMDLLPQSERPKGIRELSLGGIVYVSSNDWVVWLNGQRLTPKAIPKEVIDIHVRKEYVELKWFDGYTNLIYPIRIRPHQRFNLDSRIFLPGQPS
ncbi:MAG: hypothetical protein H6868_05980 [Rhodospirillales bacterium]|nr:hypothetical protein [Rhodospirillales bacterium]